MAEIKKIIPKFMNVLHLNKTFSMSLEKICINSSYETFPRLSYQQFDIQQWRRINAADVVIT